MTLWVVSSVSWKSSWSNNTLTSLRVYGDDTNVLQCLGLTVFSKFILQTLVAHPQQPSTSSSNSITDVSFYSSLSSSSLTSVTASVNGPSSRNQVKISHLSYCYLYNAYILIVYVSKCSGGELVSVRELCGVCRLGGGDLTHCLQCLESFHVHCHFSK